MEDTLSRGPFLWSNAIRRALLCPFTLGYSALHSGGEPYSHELYEAESGQIEDKFEEVQELIYTRDTLYISL